MFSSHKHLLLWSFVIQPLISILAKRPMKKQYIIINFLKNFSERRLQYCWSKSADLPSSNPVVRSKSYNIPMLTPVAEYDSEVSSVGSVGIRRHSACDVTSCIGPLSVGIETSSTPRLSLDHDLTLSGVMRGATGQPALISPPVFIHSSAGCLHAADAPMASSEVDKTLSSPPSCSSSPETIVMQGLDSLESDPDGIFIDFSHCRSDSFGTSRKTSWSIAMKNPFQMFMIINYHYFLWTCEVAMYVVIFKTGISFLLCANAKAALWKTGEDWI